MPDSPAPEIPATARPDAARYAFDVHDALASVLVVRAQIPEDALTAPVLGTERAGNGVVIDAAGLVLTIGYLIAEAEAVWLIGGDQRATPAHVVGYDADSGLGLVQALEPLDLPALAPARAAGPEVGDRVIAAGSGGLPQALATRVVAVEEFAGYWEYLLEAAVFTAPAHPNWGGAALIGEDGRLHGIGSLLVQRPGPQAEDSNMFVPIGLLAPVLDELLRFGRPQRPARPWLGVFVQEIDEELVVAGVYRRGPASGAGVRPGDVLLEVDGAPVTGLAELFRRVWALGEAGVGVPLTLRRDGARTQLTVPSVDRYALMRSAPLH